MGEKSTELARVRPENDAVEVLRRGYEKLQANDLAVTRGVNRFIDLPTRAEDPTGEKIAALFAMSDDELHAAGWKSRKELRLAYYGTRPKKDWPAATQSAHERVGMRIRKQAQAPQKNVFNLNMVTIPAPKRPDESRIITVEAEDKPEF